MFDFKELLKQKSATRIAIITGGIQVGFSIMSFFSMKMTQMMSSLHTTKNPEMDLYFSTLYSIWSVVMPILLLIGAANLAAAIFADRIAQPKRVLINTILQIVSLAWFVGYMTAGFIHRDALLANMHGNDDLVYAFLSFGILGVLAGMTLPQHLIGKRIRAGF